MGVPVSAGPMIAVTAIAECRGGEQASAMSRLAARRDANGAATG
jgi:hypothetical protein